ncbi:MAG TPA: Gldg family protein [Hyphomicrobium sp.]|nr:Gldg family protein [Hyphomicrobium sp.]
MSERSEPVKRALAPLAAWCAKLKRSTLAWSGLALAAVILLSVNLASSIGLKTWSADLTQDKLFTISDGTRQILKSIDEPINAQLYFSRNLADASPQVARYFDRVRTLFEQYRDISGGRLRLTVVDPEPFSDSEDKAVAAGLKGLRLNAEGETGYFGLVATNATDNQATIPFFSPDRESYLEYDVTKLIYGLANPKKRVVGLMTSLPVDGGKSPMRQQPTPPWLIMSQIREFFDVRTIDQDVKQIPSDIDVLMVAQPTKLTPQAAYAIDQYVMHGGKLLAFIDPVAESAEMQLLQDKGNGREELAKLLKGWGVNFDHKQVATDIRHARRVQFGGGNGVGPDGQPMVTDFVAWLALDKSSINANDVLAAGIDEMNLASAGVLTKVDGATINFSPILQTSSEAEIVPPEKVGFAADPVSLLRNYVPGGHKLVLAARISGETKSAFPDGAPKPADDKKADDKSKANDKDKKDATADAAKPAAVTPVEAPEVKSGKINAIVVADSDLLADRFWVNRNAMGQDVAIPIANNGAFVVSALENLSGSNALIALRSRGIKERPFTLVEDLQRSAEQKFRTKEQGLEQKLKTAQTELQKIESSGQGGNGVILTDKEQEAVDKFRGEMVSTRRELRKVKLALRQDIDSLDGWLKFANIGFVPLMLGAAAVGMSWRRSRRRRNKNDR